MQATVIAQGLTTVFGKTRSETLAHVAAKTLAMRRQRGFLGADFNPQLSAFIDPLGQDSAIERMTRLSTSAIDDLAQQLTEVDFAIGGSALTAAICLPRPDAAEGLSQQALDVCAEGLLQCLSSRLHVPVVTSSLFFSDGAGFAQALTSLNATVARGTSVVVVCADSYACRRRLRILGDAGHLFSKATPYGLIPGEAASAILLRPVTPYVDGIVIAGAAISTDTIGETDVGDSDYGAMTQASKAALPDDRLVGTWITDWNNSRYRAAETSYAQLRLAALLKKPLNVVHPALLLGDTGAASSALALALTANVDCLSLITASGGRGSRMKGAISVLSARGR